MTGITFLCCVNDEQQLKSMLIPSFDVLSNNGIEYNIVFIDAQKCQYHSAAEAYNVEVKKNNEILKDILVFLHQDIAFNSAELFLKIIQELSNNPNQIIGLAGMPLRGRTISNLKYKETDCYIAATRVYEKTEVCSVDECCFALTKDVFLKLLFDDTICNGWHLYAVELCYRAASHLNVPSYVLPEIIYHKMNGTTGLTTDFMFLKTIWRIARKYKNYTMKIYAPCYIVSTSFIPCLLKIIRTYFKNLLNR